MLILVAHAAETAATEAGGLAALGLNVGGLIFQVVNFAILLFVLHRFAYRPLLRVLEARRRTIEESLQSAVEIEKRKKQAEQQQRQRLAQVRREAEAVMTQVEREAKLIQERAVAAGQEAAERFMAQAKSKIAQQVSEARQTLRRETLQLVAAATEQVLQQKVDEKKDAALIKAAITEAEAAIQDKTRRRL